MEKLTQNFDIEVALVHFPLHPDTPADGLALAELFAGRDVDINTMNTRMKGLMEAEGLPYGTRTHTYNSRLAQELGKWAETQEGGAAIHTPLYQAYFVEGRNIGDVEVLVDIAARAGLSAETARQVLEERLFSDMIDADWDKSRQYGVTGVPTFVAARQGVVGAQPYEALEEFLTSVGAQRKSP